MTHERSSKMGRSNYQAFASKIERQIFAEQNGLIKPPLLLSKFSCVVNVKCSHWFIIMVFLLVQHFCLYLGFMLLLLLFGNRSHPQEPQTKWEPCCSVTGQNGYSFTVSLAKYYFIPWPRTTQVFALVWRLFQFTNYELQKNVYWEL